MIISDGTTDLEYEYADERILDEHDKSTRTSSGGRLKSQASGRRVVMSVRVRMTKAGYQALYALVTGGADKYYYTPEIAHPVYDDLLTPYVVSIEELKPDWVSSKVAIVTFTVKSVDYV